MYVVEKDNRKLVISNYMLENYLNDGFKFCRKINVNKTLTSLKSMPVSERTVEYVIKFFERKIGKHKELIDNLRNQLNTFEKELNGLE